MLVSEIINQYNFPILFNILPISAKIYEIKAKNVLQIRMFDSSYLASNISPNKNFCRFIHIHTQQRDINFNQITAFRDVESCNYIFSCWI